MSESCHLSPNLIRLHFFLYKLNVCDGWGSFKSQLKWLLGCVQHQTFELAVQTDNYTHTLMNYLLQLIMSLSCVISAYMYFNLVIPPCINQLGALSLCLWIFLLVFLVPPLLCFCQAHTHTHTHTFPSNYSCISILLSTMFCTKKYLYL